MGGLCENRVRPFPFLYRIVSGFLPKSDIAVCFGFLPKSDIAAMSDFNRIDDLQTKTDHIEMVCFCFVWSG